MGNVFSKPKRPKLAPTITQADRPKEQATRQPRETERRIAAAQGQLNLTNVLASDTETAPASRARRRVLGV